jgi:hypothetical protein
MLPYGLSICEHQNQFMQKQLFSLLAFITISVSGFSQETKPGEPYPGKTSFYAEFGGPGILFSANLDTRFKKTNLGWGGRVGLGFVTDDRETYDPVTGYYSYGNRKSVITVPVQVNYIFGKSASPHTFEVGAGLTALSKKIDAFNFDDEDPTYVYGTFSFMYRRQPAAGGFTWRIGFTPMVSGGYIQPSGGASVGWSF